MIYKMFIVLAQLTLKINLATRSELRVLCVIYLVGWLDALYRDQVLVIHKILISFVQ